MFFKGFFFRFLALAAILFSGAEPFERYLYRAMRVTFLRNHLEMLTGLEDVV